MGVSVPAGMKFWYDDGSGTPVDVTLQVLTCGAINEQNDLQQTDPFGTTRPVFDPTGRGSLAPFDVGFLFKTGVGSVDALFSGRVPEAEGTPSRTFTIQYLTGRLQSEETQLKGWKRDANVKTGIVMATATLQPSGEKTPEIIP